MYLETLRKYPVVTVLMRQSMSSYTFDGTKVSIPKDQKIWIPAYAIHRDSSIYPEPDVFDPERFNDEAVQTFRRRAKELHWYEININIIYHFFF